MEIQQCDDDDTEITANKQDQMQFNTVYFAAKHVYQWYVDITGHEWYKDKVQISEFGYSL